ncbi:putative structural/gag protein [Trichoderma atroviride mycovirus]|uniref:Putative structural/gag protein n=1 Tax=Trichoderma atroviride mycovirus TaxID=1934322 RepID=A0A1P8DF80_9VIRU|nr:putative structural/gag protein [Trichoderma atroviride mycovirus]APU87539.1 putative structural/gag protein [Trichoderma atroviride mycovirus]
MASFNNTTTTTTSTTPTTSNTKQDEANIYKNSIQAAVQAAVFVSKETAGEFDTLNECVFRVRGAGQRHVDITYCPQPFPSTHKCKCLFNSKLGRGNCSQPPEGFPVLNDATVSASDGLCYLLAWTPEYRYCVLSLLGFVRRVGMIRDLYQRSHKGAKRPSAKIFFTRVCATTPRGGHYHHISAATPAQKRDKSCDTVQSIFTNLDTSHNSCLLGLAARVTAARASDSDVEVAKRVKDSGLKPAFSGTTPPISALGGVREVPTSLIVPRLGDGYNRKWSTELFATQMIIEDVDWTLSQNDHDVHFNRESEFVYHFPEELQNPRLSRHFTDNATFKWWVSAQDGTPDRWLPTNYTRYFEPSQTDRIVLEPFSAIGKMLSGELSLDVLKEADSSAAFGRAMGSRGQRLIPGWEAGLTTRWQRFRDFGTRQRKISQHLEFCYRLITRYIISRVTAQALNRIQRYAPNVGDTHVHADIVFINAATIVPAPPAPGVPPALPVNGEDAFWAPGAQQALLEGRAQFLDCEGMERSEIAQLLGCLDQSTDNNLPVLSRDDMNVLQVPVIGRHTFPNGVQTIFVHTGNQPVPSPADQQWIRDNAHSYPDHTIIGPLIRSLCMRHDLSTQFTDAIDMAVYRCVGYSFEDCFGTSNDRRTDDIIDGSGNSELFIPHNNTAGDYFDIFFTPAPIDREVEVFLSLQTKQLTHSASLAVHTRTVAYNWAAKAGSMLGDIWAAPLAGAPNDYVRNHATKWLRNYYSDINIWSGLAANAHATQYGFCASPLTRRTELGRLPNWWRAYVAPYITNHYLVLWCMQVMPTFQILPYFDQNAQTSHVRWAEGTPDQSESRISFRNNLNVRLAREFEAYPGHTWIGDGGSEFNSQFYAAQGNDGQFAYEGALTKVGLCRWDGIYARQLPAAPVAGRAITLGAAGSPFSDFILPGSLASYQFGNDRIQNWAVQPNPRRPLTNQEASRWWAASKGQSNVSLMVNYVSPIAEHIEIDSLADYSVVIWENQSGFAGLTYMNNYESFSNPDLPLSRLLPDQSPFTVPFDSAPKPYMQNQPTRVTSKPGTRQTADQDTKPLGSNTSVSVADAFNKRIAATGSISYETKYPLFEDELPSFKTAEVSSDQAGLHFTTTPLGGRTPKGRLERIRELELARDAEYEEYVRESQLKEASARAEANARKAATPAYHTIVTKRPPKTKGGASAVANSLSHMNFQRDRAPLPSSISVSTKGYKPKINLPPPPQGYQWTTTPTNTHPPVFSEEPNPLSSVKSARSVRFSGDAKAFPENVEPNDSAAAVVQERADFLSTASPVGLNRNPATIIAGSRRSDRPPPFSPHPGQNSPYMSGARSLAEELSEHQADFDEKDGDGSENTGEVSSDESRVSRQNINPKENFRRNVRFGDLDFTNDPHGSEDIAIQRLGEAFAQADATTRTPKN